MIQLLRHAGADGRTALAEMIGRGSQPSWVVRAKGADFGVKDLLRERGYRWAADGKVWLREVADDRLVEERSWLAAHVYAVEARPRATCPDIERITPRTRFL